MHGLIRRASTFNTGRIDHLYTDPHEPQAAAVPAPRRSHRRFAAGHPAGEDSPGRGLQPGRAVTRAGVLRRAGVHRHRHRHRHHPAARGDPHDRAGTAASTRRRSSEMFGATPPPQNEDTPFYPRSPYGAAKVYSYWMTRNYREAYGMFAVNGILFNHESPRRGETFVTRKIATAAARIAAGLQDHALPGQPRRRPRLGLRQGVRRGDVADAAARPSRPTSWSPPARRARCASSPSTASRRVGLDWTDHVSFDPRYLRPTEVDALIGDASKARELLGWTAQVQPGRTGPDHGRRGDGQPRAHPRSGHRRNTNALTSSEEYGEARPGRGTPVRRRGEQR